MDIELCGSIMKLRWDEPQEIEQEQRFTKSQAYSSDDSEIANMKTGGNDLSSTSRSKILEARKMCSTSGTLRTQRWARETRS